MEDLKFDHLTEDASKAAQAVLEISTQVLARVPDCGGCRAFYDPEEWAALGREPVEGAVLLMAHDGGDLSDIFSHHSKGQYIEEVVDLLEKAGYVQDPINGWSSAIFKD